MTIVNTIFRRSVFGNMKIVIGKSVLSGSTNTGDVETGLRQVKSFTITEAGSSAKANSVDETFPKAGGDVTAVTESNDATFYWEAKGR